MLASHRPRFGPHLIAAAVLALAGCGSNGVSGSLEEGTVSGVVTFKGKPITSGQVAFNAANASRRDVPARTADIGPDGRYTVKALVGGNQVSLKIPNMRKLGVDPMRAGKVIDVNPGENTCDIDMPEFRPPPQP